MNSLTTPNTSSTQLQTVSIQANQPWQKSGVSVPAGIEVTLKYTSGTWTADPQNNGGQLYDANGDSAVTVPNNETSYPITGAAMGALVGRINGGTPFLVGNGPYAILTSEGGELELCINDDLTGTYGAGLTDNKGSVSVDISVFNNSNTQPDLSAALITEPPQTSPDVPLAELGSLKHIIGTWKNQNLPGINQGGPDSPYAYNVMPLPQVDPSTPEGFILKNFSYYEELTFTAIHGNAANRGGIGQQVAYTLFYEQRVYFAEGPNKDALVHAENGSILLLLDSKQPLGPYGNGDAPGLGNQTVSNSSAPTQAFNLVKQVSVPHGNSILALGNSPSGNGISAGSPTIPATSAIPTNPSIDTTPYSTLDPVSNPNPTFTANPNQVLIDALNARPSTQFIELHLSSSNGAGAITNIGFEEQHANVTEYDFTYWIEAFDNNEEFTQLQYSQTIVMQMPINGKMVAMPHVTTNTLTKVSQ